MITLEIHTQLAPGDIRPRMPVLRWQSGFYLTGTLFALNKAGAVRAINLRDKPLLMRTEDVEDIMSSLGDCMLATIQEGMYTTTGILIQLPWELASGLGLDHQRRLADDKEYRNELLITHEVLALAYLNDLGIVPRISSRVKTLKGVPGHMYLDQFIKEYRE